MTDQEKVADAIHQMKMAQMVWQSAAHNTVAGVQPMGANGDIGVQGVRGPVGSKGVTGEPGKKRYELGYLGLAFSALLETDTPNFFADPQNIVKEELDFLAVVNNKEWLNIRGEWAREYNLYWAHKAFDHGEYIDD